MSRTKKKKAKDANQIPSPPSSPDLEESKKANESSSMLGLAGNLNTNVSWDFSTALGVLNLPDTTPPSEPQTQPESQHDAKPARPTLGDFSRVWAFLGTPGPSVDTSHRMYLPNLASIVPPSALDNQAYASDGGASYLPANLKKVGWDNKLIEGNADLQAKPSHFPSEDTDVDGYASENDELSETPSKRQDKTKASPKRRKNKPNPKKRRSRRLAAQRNVVTDPESETNSHSVKKATPASRASVHSASSVHAHDDPEVGLAAGTGAETNPSGHVAHFHLSTPPQSRPVVEHLLSLPAFNTQAAVVQLQQSLDAQDHQRCMPLTEHVTHQFKASNVFTLEPAPQPTPQPAAQAVQPATGWKKKFTHETYLRFPKADRDFQLRLRLINQFGEDKHWLMKAVQSANHFNDPNGIHVFVDFSNIQIGFYRAVYDLFVKHRLPLPQGGSAPLSFDSLVLLLERDRPVSKRVLAGSYPLLPAMSLAESIGYECNIMDKVPKTNKKEPWKGQRNYEQGVDEVLQLKMSHTIMDADIEGYGPSTIVLATGDGAAAEYSDGFLKMVERALHKGWNVELVAWRESIGHGYKKRSFKEKWAGKFRIIELDQYADFLLDSA